MMMMTTTTTTTYWLQFNNFVEESNVGLRSNLMTNVMMMI